MEEDSLDSRDVEVAKAFWAAEDVERIFSRVSQCVDHLRTVLLTHTATDKEYLQAVKLLEFVDPPPSSPDAVVQVVIGSGLETPCSNGTAPPTPLHPQYTPHSCCKACLPSLPSMPQSTPPFWAQNPLKIPLLCGFKRLSSAPVTSPEVGVACRGEGAEPEEENWEVVYKAPCGLSLRCYDDVMRFLLATESYDILQVDFFSFNPCVCVAPPPPPGPRRPELDLSRGVEATPVELCPGAGGARPAEFRYRKERWPHGCFLSRGAALFSACCDCADGCSDARRCACVAMTTGGRNYSYQRLDQPVPSGVYECGPWCGCGARCLNRLVQRGVRVRLQVFQTDGRGWGVRCRDDLDRGTFVCIYAGVILNRVQSSSEPSPPKLTRADLPSDDEVEVVTEWLAPPVLEGRGQPAEGRDQPTEGRGQPAEGRGLQGDPATATSHVPVIQRPSEAPPCDLPPPAATVAMETVNGAKETASRKRATRADHVKLIDASKEGNVSRFINHSCRPNLMVQSVFTDCHDPDYPVTAFFTSRVVSAGSELTWDYSAATHRKQEVPCVCGSDGCRGSFSVEESLCDLCEVEGESQ